MAIPLQVTRGVDTALTSHACTRAIFSRARGSSFNRTLCSDSLCTIFLKPSSLISHAMFSTLLDVPSTAPTRGTSTSISPLFPSTCTPSATPLFWSIRRTILSHSLRTAQAVQTHSRANPNAFSVIPVCPHLKKQTVSPALCGEEARNSRVNIPDLTASTL